MASSSNFCCSCNGSNARCKRCLCVSKKRPCTNCRPSRSNLCQNNIQLRQKKLGSTSSVCAPQSSPLISCGVASESSCGHLVDAPTTQPRDLTCGSRSVTQSQTDSIDGLDINSYMMRAFGEPLASTGDVSQSTSIWYTRWQSVANLSGKQYSLPGGSIGRKYVDLLTLELTHLSSGIFPSERVLTFSSLILQRDRTIKKGADIRRVLERRLNMWENEEFDILVQEAVRCDKILAHHQKSVHSPSQLYLLGLCCLGKLKQLLDGYLITLEVIC